MKGLILTAIVSLIVIVGTCMLIQVGAIKWGGVTGAMEEGARKNVFEQSRTFQEGKQQDLANYYLQWQSADDTGKAGICTLVRQQFSDSASRESLDSAQREFIRKCGGF